MSRKAQSMSVNVTSDFLEQLVLEWDENPPGQPWPLSSNTLSGDLCTWVSQMLPATEAWTSLWTTHLQESYPIPQHLAIFLYFQQIGAGNCSGNSICFLHHHHLPANGAPKALSFSNMKPHVILSHLMADPGLRRSVEVSSHCNYLHSYDIKIIWPW